MAESRSASPEKNGSHVAADYDSADRERALAEQLRRRAMASKHVSSTSRKDRDLSRSPPSRSSHSPPPRRSRSRSRSVSRSESRSRSPAERRIRRRRDDREERERDRRRRRSGRDEDKEDVDAADESYESERRRRRRRADTRDAEDDGATSRGFTEERERRSVRAASRLSDRLDDDTRSQRSTHSRRYDSPADHSYYEDYNRRRDIDRSRDYDRRRPSRRYDYDQYDAYYRGGVDYRSPSYYGHERRPSRRRSPSPPRARARTPTPEPEDYERRSVFCSQLAARLTQRDLGEFFEEKLGEDTVKDVRIVTDRATGRGKGIGYVELMSEELVPRAVECSGEKLFGIPILVQLTEAARNRGEGASTASAPIRPNLSGSQQPQTSGPASLPLPPHLATAYAQQVAPSHRNATYHANTDARLYVGSLHFSLVDTDIKAIFEPFGTIEHVDLHREPTGKSKGYAFVQYRETADAEKAIEHMNGFELAGRNIRVGHVNARGQEGKTQAQIAAAPSVNSADALQQAQQAAAVAAGTGATITSSFDEGGGGGLNAHSRANLMQMLSRNETPASSSSPAAAERQARPANIPESTSKAVLLKNMFNPAEETEKHWDKDLSEDVKAECQSKYGAVSRCYVDAESSYGEIYVLFADVDGATKAIAGLNGRWFGGRQVSAGYISESFMTAKLG